MTRTGSTEEDVITEHRLRPQVDAALDAVIDPCSSVAGVPAGLAEMGLVRDVAITETAAGAAVAITIAVTHPSCFMAPVFLQQVEEQVQAIAEVAEVTVRLDQDFDWMPEDMAPGYRARLAEHRAEKLVLPVADQVVSAR